MGQVSEKNLHLIRKPGQSMTTGKLLYIPVERATVLTSYCVINGGVDMGQRGLITGHFERSCD